MKKISLFALLWLAIGSVAHAQTAQKIGYTSVNFVLTQLPDAKRIESELKTYQTQLEKTMQDKMAVFKEKMAKYEGLTATTPDLVKTDMEKELQGLQTSLQEFQRNAQTDLQKKEASLLQPVVKKIYDTASEVGKENGYAFIINSDESNPVLILAPKENDISDLVVKKLGGPVAAAKPAAAASAQPKPAGTNPQKKN